MTRPMLSPTVPPVPCPAVDITASTLGFFWMISDTACWRFSSSAKVTPSGARVPPKNTPVSWRGMKPCGTAL